MRSVVEAGGSLVSEVQDPEIDIWALGQILWRRRLVIAAVAVVLSILGVALALRRPPAYKAVAVLQVAAGADIVPVVAPMVADQSVAGARRTAADTNAQLVKSPEVLTAALAQLTDKDRAVLPTQWWELPVSVTTSATSDLITIEVISSDPKAAIALVNAVAEVYVARAGRSNREIVSAITRSLEPELTAAKERFEKAQEALTRARERTGVYAYDIEYKRVLDNLSQVRRSSPDAPVRSGIADVELELASQQAALKEAERLLGSGGNGEASELRNRADVCRIAIAESKAKLARLRQEEALLERRLGELNQLGVQMRTLEAEVTAKETVYRAVQDKAQQMMVNAATQLSTVQLASRAKAPLRPAGTPRRLVALAGGVVGLVLGVALALVQEGAERRRRRPVVGG